MIVTMMTILMTSWCVACSAHQSWYQFAISTHHDSSCAPRATLDTNTWCRIQITECRHSDGCGEIVCLDFCWQGYRTSRTDSNLKNPVSYLLGHPLAPLKKFGCSPRISPSLTNSGLRFNLQSWVGAVKAVVNVGVKPLLNAPVNAGRIVNAEVTFYCPVFFASRAVSNWSQFAHKISATRYYRTAKAWVAKPFSYISYIFLNFLQGLIRPKYYCTSHVFLCYINQPQKSKVVQH